MDGATKQCKVTSITAYETGETPYTSTVNYSITFQDPNCFCQEPLHIFLKECEKEKKPAVQLLKRMKCQQIDDQYGVSKNGMWMLLLDGHKSNCFSTPGREVFPRYRLPTFTKNELTLEFLDSDIRIKTWNLTIYKAENLDLTCINNEQRKKDHIPFVGNSSILQLKYKFDPKGCYCLKLRANGEVPLETIYSSSPLENCIYIPKKADIPKNNSAFNLWQVITLMVLAAVILMIVLAVVLFIFNKRRRVYSNSNRNTKKATVLEIPDTCELLLLYADDCQHHHREVLKDCLQPHLKVHDLYQHDDMERLADCNGWLQMKLLNSSMNIVLVDSPMMTTYCSSLQTLHNDKSSVEQPAEEQQILLQLKFAVHIIITTSLARDYSRVFVIRFDDASVEEEEGLGLIVNCRRYNLPSHQHLLLRDILTTEAVL